MSIRNYSMYQGAILGSLLVFCGLLFHVFGILTCEKPIMTLFVNTTLMFVILFLSITKYRELYNEGLMNYSTCVKIGISVSVFSALFFGLWKILYINIINPDFNNLCIDFAQQQLLQLDDQIPGLLGENLEENLDRLDEGRINQPHHMILFNEIISKTIGSFIISSILFFFVKKEDPNLMI